MLLGNHGNWVKNPEELRRTGTELGQHVLLQMKNNVLLISQLNINDILSNKRRLSTLHISFHNLRCLSNIELYGNLRTSNHLFGIELFINIKINILLVTSEVTTDYQTPLQSLAVV